MVLGLLVFFGAWPIASQLTFDRTIATMFPSDDPTLLDYQSLQDAFGGNVVVMIVYHDDDLMSDAGLSRSKALSAAIGEVEGVDGVLSPSVLNDLVAMMRPVRFFTDRSSEPALARRGDRVARGIDLVFSGYTHSLDHDFAAVVALLKPEHPPETIEQLREIASGLRDRFDGKVGQGYLVGEPVLINDAFDLVERDGRRLATITLGLLSIVVLISLLDFRFVLLTVGIVGWSVVVAEAISVMVGIHRSLVSTIMTAIVTVVAVAAILHLGVRYQNHRRTGLSKIEACNRSLSTLIVPIFWTCMTDAAGFAALGWSRILPVRQFGAMIAIASIAVFAAVLLFAAFVMMLPELRIAEPLQRIQNRVTVRVSRGCTVLARGFVSYRKTATLAAIGLMMVSVYGTWQARAETSFLNNFRADSPIVEAYNQVETNLGGAGIWDVVLPAPRKLSNEYIRQVIELEKKLRAVEVDGTKLTKVLSLADADYVASLAPLLRFTPSAERLSAMKETIPVFFEALLTTDPNLPRQMRIMLRSQEQLPAEVKSALIAQVQMAAAEHVRSDEWKAVFGESDRVDAPKVTGYYVIMSQLVGQLIGDQWRCLAAAGGLVWLLLWLATGSLRLSIAALLPNLLPAFIVLAAAGFLDGKINMGATMIAAVSIGLTIDGSVHLLANYRRLRHRGHRVDLAVSHAAGNVGIPVILATIALVVGFSILSSSEFVPTATFGILIAATLCIGTVVNLTLLPACVALMMRSDETLSSRL
ncbi:MMPL family protein [Novipirellula aureliae]|uniref:MMPL family protein n=2 Tax=Novipirellula aureliae TaxID=2527966 RepID=A0A5C6E8H3_9BACT|nr:MMPL family protein [Novipirellula aureliae]